MSRVRQNSHFLSLLHTTNNKQKKQLLKAATREQILTLSEIVLNLLEGNLPVSHHDLQSLLKFKNILRKLGSFSLNIIKKKKLLTSYSHLIDFLLNLLWEELSSIIEGKEQEEEDQEGEYEEGSSNSI